MREHPWMAEPQEEKDIVSTLWAAEAMARDRQTVMAVTSDLKVRQEVHVQRAYVVETVRWHY